MSIHLLSSSYRGFKPKHEALPGREKKTLPSLETIARAESSVVWIPVKDCATAGGGVEGKPLASTQPAVRYHLASSPLRGHACYLTSSRSDMRGLRCTAASPAPIARPPPRPPAATRRETAAASRRPTRRRSTPTCWHTGALGAATRTEREDSRVCRDRERGHDEWSQAQRGGGRGEQVGSKWGAGVRPPLVLPRRSHPHFKRHATLARIHARHLRGVPVGGAIVGCVKVERWRSEQPCAEALLRVCVTEGWLRALKKRNCNATSTPALE